MNKLKRKMAEFVVGGAMGAMTGLVLEGRKLARKKGGGRDEGGMEEAKEQEGEQELTGR